VGACLSIRSYSLADWPTAISNRQRGLVCENPHPATRWRRKRRRREEEAKAKVATASSSSSSSAAATAAAAAAAASFVLIDENDRAAVSRDLAPLAVSRRVRSTAGVAVSRRGEISIARAGPLTSFGRLENGRTVVREEETRGRRRGRRGTQRDERARSERLLAPSSATRRSFDGVCGARARARAQPRA